MKIPGEATDVTYPEDELDNSHSLYHDHEIPTANRQNIADKASYGTWILPANGTPAKPFKIAPYDLARQDLYVYIVGNATVLIGKQQDLENAWQNGNPVAGGVIVSGSTNNVQNTPLKITNNEELWAWPFRFGTTNTSYLCVINERWIKNVP